MASITGNPTVDGEYTVTITATDSAAASGSATFSWSVTEGLSVGQPVWVTCALIEEGEPISGRVPKYFDGDSGLDYLWEVGGNEGSTRSYYYKNRAERRAAVVRILKANVPMGIGIADPEFAVLPVTDDTIGMFEAYGSGFYGFGVYGG